MELDVGSDLIVFSESFGLNYITTVIRVSMKQH